MKVLVVGASGAIGSRLVPIMAEQHEVLAASRSTGADTASGRGLQAVLHGVQVVIDVTNIRSRDPNEVRRFFESSTRNLAAAGREAGVLHHLVLSVVGADLMEGSGYMRGKVAQEQALRESGLPFTIVRATQFFEFVATFGDLFASGDEVRVPDANMQPIASDDVAVALAGLASCAPANGIVDLGGPDVMTIREAVSRILEAHGDRRPVIASSDVLYSGARITQGTLVPRPNSLRGQFSLTDWLSRHR